MAAWTRRSIWGRPTPRTASDARRRVASAGRVAGAGIVAAALAAIVPCRAEELRDALRQALRTNPSLAAARADTVAIGEAIVQAKAPGRPRASITASETEYAKQTVASTLTPDRTLRSDVSIGVPLYRSGVVRYAVKEAEERYGAARQSLRASVADLLGSVVAVYSDVARDEAIVRASERNVAALQANLRGIRGRFSIGDMTITDVALSEARLSLAEGSLQSARSQLIASRENYLRLVGTPPADLAEIGGFAGLPDAVDTAVAEAIDNNGALRSARLTVDATAFRIRSLQGERGLRVSAFAGGGYFNNLNSVDNRSIFAPRDKGTAAQLGIALELPLYQGGLPASRIREARADRIGAIEQAIALEREVVAQARSAFAGWKLSAAQLAKSQEAIVASERALKGARAENAIGTRTLLDVLDIERELFNNYVAAAIVRRNVNVASFSLLAVMGRADPDDLGLAEGEVGREMVGEARGSWSDWADGRARYASASTTTDALPPQDGAVRP